MTAVEIEYCVPCGFLPRAVDVQQALLEEFGRELDRVALVTGDGGVFEVAVDDETVFDKAQDEFSIGEIVDRVRSHVGAAS